MHLDIDMVPSREEEHKSSYSGKKVKRFLSKLQWQRYYQREQESAPLCVEQQGSLARCALLKEINVHASACGHTFVQVQKHWFSHSCWVFSTSENQATYFAAQLRLLKPNVVTHFFFLSFLSLIRMISTRGFYTPMYEWIQEHNLDPLCNHFLLRGRFLPQSKLCVVWWMRHSHTESQWLEEMQQISHGRDSLPRSQTWGNSLTLTSLISDEIRL